MSQTYSDPKRASDPHALPDVDVFYVHAGTAAGMCPLCSGFMEDEQDANHETKHVGYYWQSCFPGCLPDGEPNGPFPTEAEALADAQSGSDDDGGNGEVRS